MRRIVIASQMRTGSTWLAHIAERLSGVDCESYRRNPGAYLSKVHGENPADLCANPDNRVLSITRDLRDILVSRYFFRKYKHGKQPLSDGDRFELNRILMNGGAPNVRRQVTLWKMYNDFSAHNYLLVKYENLKRSPEEQIQRIAGFLNMKPTSQEIDEIVDRTSFKTETGGRFPGDEVKKAHRRKGIVGDWSNWLEPETNRKILECLASV